MNFCFDFLQELLMVWEAISNIRKGVSSDIQTPWSWLKKTRLRLVFSTTSRCLDIGWNTLPRVWYIISNSKMHGALDLILTGDFCIDQSRYRSGNANTNQNHYFSIYYCSLRLRCVTPYWPFPRNTASFRDNFWVQRLTVSHWVFSWYIITAKI